MTHDIDKNIAIIEKALDWAKEYCKDSFPQATFKEYRRKLKRIKSALEENCSAAAYGESQVGKSYLMSSLLSTANSPFVIKNNDKEYSFIDEINPSGGANSNIESTGVITRFTIEKDKTKALPNLVRVKLLSIVDIILLITDSYYNDIKLNPDTTIKYDDINSELNRLTETWNGSAVNQSQITDDDIKDINDYIKDVIGNNAASIYQSNFCKSASNIISRIPAENWVDLFGLLWNNNEEMSHLFCIMINEYKKLGFESDIYVPFDAVIKDNGTILKIDWLDSVCGAVSDTGKDITATDIYNKSGNVIARNFNKGYLSALIAELTFVLPKNLATDRQFLEKLDLLDFPGARSREKYKESDIKTVLPKILRRGKVAYLFNKYSRSLRISSVLFCHHNNQKSEPSIGETINAWIEENIGKTPEERGAMLLNTNKIAPLFMIATKFNKDLERVKTDMPGNTDKLDDHWNRFNTVIPEIIKPNKWMENWVNAGTQFKSTAFQNVYPLRDFYWSGKGNLFVGYNDGATKSEETSEYLHSDYPDYMQCLKESFMRNDFVKKHFGNPEETWNDVATLNNDGSKAIIKSLDSIANVLDSARKKKYLAELLSVKNEIISSLSSFYEPEDNEEKNKKAMKISADIKKSLMLGIGSDPEIFGKIIDTLMFPVNEIRNIAYDIIICHTHTPISFSAINFVRASVGINTTDNRETNIEKLTSYFGCDEKELGDSFAQKGFSINDVISAETETLTTVAGVVTKHIIDKWIEHLNVQSKKAEELLPHSNEIVLMLINLQKKLNLKKVLQETIDKYCNIFSANEQPNAIADFASLTLNNFVSSVGRNYIKDDEITEIETKAKKCNLIIDTNPISWDKERKQQSIIDTLNAFDEAKRIIDKNSIDLDVLRKLPLWDNFLRWQNMVTIGLIYASDISQCDPIANEKIKELINDCETLYN